MIKAWGTEPYFVGPDDQIKVSVYGEQELSQIYRVSASNEISMPMIGQINVDAMTTEKIAQTITYELSRNYIRSPQVAVQIEKFRPFFISGEVLNSNQFDFFSGVTVRRAIAMAGGFTDYADKKYARIVRNVNGQPYSGQVPLDFTIFPGDVIEIPQQSFGFGLSNNASHPHNTSLHMQPQQPQLYAPQNLQQNLQQNQQAVTQAVQPVYPAGATLGQNNQQNLNRFKSKRFQNKLHEMQVYQNSQAQQLNNLQQMQINNPQNIPLSPSESQIEMAAKSLQRPENMASTRYNYPTPVSGYDNNTIYDPTNQSIIADDGFSPPINLRPYYQDPTQY